MIDGDVAIISMPAYMINIIMYHNVRLHMISLHEPVCLQVLSDNALISCSTSEHGLNLYISPQIVQDIRFN